MAATEPQGLGQGLLIRKPGTTQEEFNEYWERTHAPLVVPWALKWGIVYYAQVHNPTISTITSPPQDLDLAIYSGAAEMRALDTAKMMGPAMQDPYYLELILADERRFLLNNATEHIRGLPSGTVVGDRKVIIEDGKAAEGVDKEVLEKNMEVWREWEARGSGPQ